MSVHYKFKSSKDFDTVTFDGLHISIGDLKKNIIQQKKIGKGADYELQITNAQTKEVYSSDDTLVPKNTSVLVSRIPIVGANKRNWHRETSDTDALLDAELAVSSGDPHGTADSLKVADIASSSATEDDKIKAMISQSSQEFDSSKFVKKSFVGTPPASYVCYKCMKPGHWITKCTFPPADKSTPRVEVKRSTGIPRSFMVAVDDPTHQGVMLSTNGELVIPVLDAQAYQQKKIEKPPFVPDMNDTPKVEEKAPIPEELQCMICKDLLSDAVLIPCCGTCFCDECIRLALLESDHHECPQCHELDQTPEQLIPNRFLRNKVSRLKSGMKKSVNEVEKKIDISAAIVASPKEEPELATQPAKLLEEKNHDAGNNSEKAPSPDTASQETGSTGSGKNEVTKASSPIEKKTESKTKNGEIGEDRSSNHNRWPRSRSPREIRSFESDRRRYNNSPPSNYRRGYRDYSPHMNMPMRGVNDMYRDGIYQPLNPPPMPFPGQFNIPPPGFPTQQLPGAQPPPPDDCSKSRLAPPLMSFPVAPYPSHLQMMPVTMPIGTTQSEREALEEFERKLREKRHERRRRSRTRSPIRRRPSRSRSRSPRSPYRRRSRSNSRPRVRSTINWRPGSRSSPSRYRPSSRERVRNSPTDYSKPLQTRKRRYSPSRSSVSRRSSERTEIDSRHAQERSRSDRPRNTRRRSRSTSTTRIERQRTPSPVEEKRTKEKTPESELPAVDKKKKKKKKKKKDEDDESPEKKKKKKDEGDESPEKEKKKKKKHKKQQ